MSASLATTAITAIGWKRDGTMNWGLKSIGGYKSDDVSMFVGLLLQSSEACSSV